MILDLVDISNPVLRKKAKAVKGIDKKISRLISDMKETLRAQDDPEGVGLAAPQVGKSVRIFLIFYDGLEEIVINPEIKSRNQIPKSKSKAKKAEKILEGCLSLPHFYGPIRRTNKITISFMDENWRKQTKTYEDFYAQIVEHEIDHLNGILFIDHILEQKQPLYKVDGDDWQEVDLV